MKTLLCLALSTLGLLLLTHDIATAHGGTYRGAGDSVSPPGGGSGGGGAAGGGSSGGAGGSGAGGGGGGGGVAKSGGAASGGSAASVSTSISAQGTDFSAWQMWWGFNRDSYLNLRGALYRSDLLLGSDDFFLGRAPLDEARDLLKPSEMVIREKIVPALEQVLAHERDNDIVTGALIALAKIGDSANLASSRGKMAKAIAPFMADANQEIAETAAVSLGILANDTSFPILKDVLFDTPRGRELTSPQRSAQQPVNWRTRAFAAYGLGLIGYRSESADVRRQIVQALAAMLDGEATVMATPDVAVACLISLGLVPLAIESDYLPPADGCPAADRCRQAQVEWLLHFLEATSSDFIARAHATTALARLVSGVPESTGLRQRAAQRLIDSISTFSTDRREMRASAVLALGRIGDADGDSLDRSIRAALMKAFDEAREPDVKNFTLIALAHIGGRPGTGASEPFDGLSEIQAFLMKQFARASGTDRPWVVLALGVLDRGLIDLGLTPSTEAGSAIRTALKDARSPRDVGACAIAAGVRGDSESRAELVTKLSEVSDDETRGFVALALGLMGGREAIGSIQTIVKSARYRPALLRDASVSLGLLGDKNVVPELTAMLVEAKSLSTQAAIASALGFIGDARSIDPLIAMLRDEHVTARARAFAAVALGIVADKESMPWNSKLSVGINYRAGTTTLTDGSGMGILEIL